MTMNVKELYKVERVSEEITIIFCTTYVNPISHLPNIEQELKKMNFNGKVIFDLLLSNGYTSNRFVEANVFKAKVDRRSMKVIAPSSIDNSLIDKTYDFYKTHPYLLDNNNILLDEEKYYLVNSN